MVGFGKVGIGVELVLVLKVEYIGCIDMGYEEELGDKDGF